MTRQRIARAGFTLVELLVVIAILALLAALTASAVTRFKTESTEKFSNIQLQKAQIALAQQYKGAIDQIKKEQVPQSVIDLCKHANGTTDIDRAKALNMKLRLRQEFPQTFTEVDPTAFAAEYATPPAAPSSQLVMLYPPKPLYRLAIGTPGGAGAADLESAALLYLILTQTRAGSNFDVESIGRVTSVNVGGKQMKVFMDYFDSPIAFRRWADAGDLPEVATELSLPPNVAPSPAAADAEDPAKRLAATTDWLPGALQVAAKVFIPNSGASRPLFNNTVHPFDGLHRGPYAFSAGRDQLYGGPDDLLSFRIQQAGKGN